MTEKAIKNLTIGLLIIVGLILTYFLVATAIDGYWIWGRRKIDFDVTGQVGDFVGGLLGTIINGAVFYFLYLSLTEQRKSQQKQSFETKFFELVRLHRENVKELSYKKFHNGEMQISSSRKVFRVAIEEFFDCFHEVKHFRKLYPKMEFIKPAYKTQLEKIKRRNKCKESTEELALIDIAFSLFYFGVSKESESILMHKFYNRYEPQFAKKIRVFMQLKPKQQKESFYNSWKEFRNLEKQEKREKFEEIFVHSGKSNLPKSADHLVILKNLETEKFYGGHQHRFGHYFRHLFQAYRFLSQEATLNSRDRYFYGKTLRAQLSTYEQFLLFFNSLSSLGMRWEYTVDKSTVDKEFHKRIEDFKFITRYNLVKNLPGSQYIDFTYRKFYPSVDFDYRSDLTYKNRISKR